MPTVPLKHRARPVHHWLTPGVAEAVAAEIDAAGGQEVFLVGRLDEQGRVAEAEVAARGNREAVPAIALAARGGDLVLHNHPGGDLRPSDADLEVAARLGADGIGLAILDNAVTEIYVVVEPYAGEPTVRIDPAEVAAFFQPGGPLEQVLPGYEPRAAQSEMAEGVAGAFRDGRVVVVEAGTGVGKSLAYLVPALLWAVRNRRRVAISTNTINLQEQLIGSDLPLLARAGLTFRAELVKGRRNYACLRKAEEIRGEPDLFGENPQESTQLAGLAAWAMAHPEETLGDLTPPPSPDLWAEIATEADDCTRARCTYYNECPFYRARRRAASADLLIVNHHLLFADLALRQSLGAVGGTAVLPPYTHVVLDEAHHIEEVATHHFGTQLTSLGLQRQLGRLQHRRRPSRGLLPLLVRHLAPLAPQEPEAERALQRIEQQVRPALAEASSEVPADFVALGQAGEALLESAPPREQHRLRITEAIEEDPLWQQGARPACDRLRARLVSLTAAMGRLLEELAPLRERRPETLESPWVDLGAATARLEAAAVALALFSDARQESCEGIVRWMERAPARGNVPRLTLATAPIEVGPQLARSVFETLEGAVLTSATLSVRGTFEYISARLGLDRLESGRCVTAIVPSPFEPAEQARLLIPDDFGDPTEPGHQEQVARLLEPAIRAAGGRALVLLTSYTSLRRLHDLLEGPLARAGIRLRRQGEAPRRALLESLRVGAGEALLATDSFWEGIDVRGPALSLLVVTRLPFRVPTDPVLAARAERLQQEGGNAFTDLLVPMAVLKFKQGMGRLLRHRQDRGVALVLDPRILRRGYGRAFLESLGWGEPVVLPTSRVLEQVQAWFGRQKPEG